MTEDEMMDAARKAAAAMLRAYQHPDADDQRESRVLAINVEGGHCDDTIRVQAFYSAIKAAYTAGLNANAPLVGGMTI